MQLFRERLSEKCEPTILKGTMGYDQYTVPHTAAVEPTFFCFPSALADIYPWPLVPFFQISLKNDELKSTHNCQYPSGLSRALFLTTFLEIASN